jgi:hypothetical protein
VCVSRSEMPMVAWLEAVRPPAGGGVGKVSLPLNKTLTMGRTASKDNRDASKLKLGVLPTEDGVSRRQATIKVASDGTATVIIPLGTSNPVRLVPAGARALLLRGGASRTLGNGDVLELDCYNTPPL